MRSSIRSGNASDVARLAKKNQNRSHFKDTVMANILSQGIPVVPTVAVDVQEATKVDAEAKANADFLTHLETEDTSAQNKKPYVDMIRDYSDYNASGWQPNAMQQAKFERDDGPATYRYMGAEDGNDTGLLYNSAPFIGGKAQWNSDGTPMIAKDPMGRWTLVRSERAECEVPRSRRNFFIEIDGETEQVKGSIVHGMDSPNPFLYVCDFRDEVDPNLRLPVIINVERWVEEAQVLPIGDKHFAHRNALGILQFADLDGKLGASYPVMEVDPKNIKNKRRDYANLCKSWRALTADARTVARGKQERRVPRGAGAEAYLVKSEGVLAGKDNYFIEVKKNDDGKWVPVQRSTSNPF